MTLFWKTDHLPVVNASDEGQTQPTMKDMVATLKLPALWAVIIFVIMTWTFYQLFDQQMFPAWYTSLFDLPEVGQRVYGTLNSVQVFAEAAMMGVVPILMRRVGVRSALLMGVSVMAFRILGCAIFTDPIVVSGFKMLHAIEVPLFVLPIFRYITLHFNTLLSATLYMVGFQIAAQVGNVVLSPPLGSLRDAIGYQPTYFVIVGVVLAAGVFAFFALNKDDEQVLGDPFVRTGGKGRATT